MDPYSKIGRWSWKYAVVKALARAAFYVFYRKIRVTGRENIPRKGGIIFAANHQNALMDALAILLTSRYQPVFLARADIFRNPLIAGILRFLKIMPVYRFRDGVDSMGQNEETFKRTASILASGGSIGIMPEGNHGEQKRLRTLKKGIFRIAFRVAELSGVDADVKIVPVGLDFSDTARVFEVLTVNFGQPLSVSDYRELYNEHPQRGINAMKDDLAQAISSLMVDFNDGDNYFEDRLMADAAMPELKQKIRLNGPGSPSEFQMTSVFSRTLYDYFSKNPDNARKLRDYSREIIEIGDNLDINPIFSINPGIFNKVKALTARLLCYPVIVAGYAAHFIPFLVIRLALRSLKDKQFTSSFKFVLGFILVPLHYVISWVVLSLILGKVLSAGILLIMPFAGYAACRCRTWMTSSGEREKAQQKLEKNPEMANRLAHLWDLLFRGIEPVIIEALHNYSEIMENQNKQRK